MSVQVRTKNYHDPMADSRRRRRWLRRAFYLLGILLVSAGGLWLFFGSSVFAVRDIRVTGADSIGNERISASVGELLAQKKLYMFQPMRNMVLLSGQAVAEHLEQSYASIGQISVIKNYPHGLDINVTERQAVGQWCREDSCQLFDKDGVRWGSTLPSTGPLLLRVDDQRASDADSGEIFPGIMAAVAGLPEFGLAAHKVTLPNAEPGGIRLMTTRKYEIYFDALGDIGEQLAVLGVFLSDRAKDVAFAPQYIDLRTPGRVYYK